MIISLSSERTKASPSSPTEIRRHVGEPGFATEHSHGFRTSARSSTGGRPRRLIFEDTLGDPSHRWQVPRLTKRFEVIATRRMTFLSLSGLRSGNGARHSMSSS